ncbi:hypothetical protein niasHT_011784 [Heterodera trifolii]|uniref:Rho-GAP domain-containing protein n=1 Tax=Heterodera trifolii TaxID=157864 RepID=A0ABD2L590_9BILA
MSTKQKKKVMNDFTTVAIALLSRYSNNLLKKDSEAALSGEIVGDERETENIVRTLITIIDSFEENEFFAQGLYRLSGSLTTQQNALNIIENAKGRELKLYFIYELNATDKASCIKTLLRKMPDTLFPHCQRVALLDLSGMVTSYGAPGESDDRILKALQILVYFIPETHKQCLECLLIHLKRVSAHSDKNKMDESNLGLLFSSYIFPVQQQKYESIEKAKDEIAQFCRLFPVLLKHCDALFKLPVELVQTFDASLMKRALEQQNCGDLTISSTPSAFSPLLPIPNRNTKTPRRDEDDAEVAIVHSCSKRVVTPNQNTTDLEVAKLAANIASMEEGSARSRLLNKMMTVQRQKMGIKKKKSILRRALPRRNS